MYRLLIIILGISLNACFLSLERPQLPNNVACYSANCCYQVSLSNPAQICGSGNPNEFQLYLRRSN